MSANQDKLFRFLFEDLPVRGELIYLDRCWQAVTERRTYPSAVRRQLGEALAATAILSATIKFDGSLIMQLQGDGPVSTLVAQATSDNTLRGLAKWREEAPEGPLRAVFGKGQMAITIIDANDQRYQSLVSLEGNTLADTLEHYFLNSEQLASRFWLSAGEERVAGLFLQQLPAQGMPEDHWNRITMMADTVRDEELFSLEPAELLQRLFAEDSVRLFQGRELAFSCGCSREKIERTLLAMGAESLQEILDSEGSIEVDCEFCYQHYSFTADEVHKLMARGGPAGETGVLH